MNSLSLKTSIRYSFICGIFSSVAQVLFLRELLTLFSGNELTIVASITLWLLANAAGNMVCTRCVSLSFRLIITLYTISLVIGIIIIRAIPLMRLPGEQLPPLLFMISYFIVISPCPFFSGILFGKLSNRTDHNSIYRWDNAGNCTGLAVVSLLVFLNVSHFWILLSATVLMIPLLPKRLPMLFSTVIFLTVCFSIEPLSSRWKYGPDIRSIMYGREGEIAVDSVNKVTYLNRQIYKTGYARSGIEQAVHVPLSISRAKHVLLIHDNGHLEELKKYPLSHLKCIESEPALSDKQCLCISPERIQPDTLYDVILLGADIPQTLGANRLFTRNFFQKMKQIMNRSALLSFTLSINTDYLSNTEMRLKDCCVKTLSTVFRYVKIFPGEGLTFIASDQPFELPQSCTVPTIYFKDYILTGMTKEKIDDINMFTPQNIINTKQYPVIVRFSINHFLEKYNISFYIIFCGVIIGSILVFLFSFRKQSLFSIGTTGCSSGMYSIAIMMLYQSEFGALYSSVSLLMVTLTAGFFAGSFRRSFPQSDLIIGVYAFITLLCLVLLPQPPELLYFVCNFGIGVLAGSQLVNLSDRKLSHRNSADLVGGVFGIALGGIILIPFLGLKGVIIAIVLIKLCAVIIPIIKPAMAKS